VLGRLLVVVLEALVVELEAFIELVDRRFRATALELDLEADRAILARAVAADPALATKLAQ